MAKKASQPTDGASHKQRSASEDVLVVVESESQRSGTGRAWAPRRNDGSERASPRGARNAAASMENRAPASDVGATSAGWSNELRALQETVLGLRAELAEVVRTDVMAQLQDDIASLGPALARLADETSRRPPVGDVQALWPLLEEVAAVREELTQLRRRISLRATGDEADADVVGRIADAVVARLEGQSGWLRRRRRR